MTQRSNRVALGGLTVALVAAGVVLGAVWAWVAPPLPVGILPSGAATALDPESHARFNAAGVFAAGELLMGAVSGVLSWFALRRHRGALLLVTLVAGSFAAAVVAEVVGLGVAELRYAGGLAGAAAGSRTVAAPELGTWAFVLVQPFAAAVAHTVLLTFTSDDDLGHPPTQRPAEAAWTLPAGVIPGPAPAAPDAPGP